MPLTYQCPNPECRKNYSVTEAQVGRQARCKHCGTLFSVALDAAVDTGGQPLPRIGRFQVRRRLGTGAFGAVYRAYDAELDRDVAIKVPQPGTVDNPRAIERFLREAKAAARLDHPNIVPVYDAAIDRERPYIAYAFVEGRTLAETLDRGPLDFRATARIVREIAEGLAYAHSLGIVHRDVKPANIMLDAKGHAHLMDFGLAHRLDATTRLTQEGAVLGTPAYMSPEQTAGKTSDPIPASDQYSLGVIFYEMLAGRLPFIGPPAVVLYHVLHTEPQPPRQINPHVPLELQVICLRALRKDAGDRYAGCQQMAEDLRRWQQHEPLAMLQPQSLPRRSSGALQSERETIPESASAEEPRPRTSPRSRRRSHQKSLLRRPAGQLLLGLLIGIVAASLPAWHIWRNFRPRGAISDQPETIAAESTEQTKAPKTPVIEKEAINPIVKSNGAEPPAKPTVVARVMPHVLPWTQADATAIEVVVRSYVYRGQKRILVLRDPDVAASEKEKLDQVRRRLNDLGIGIPRGSGSVEFPQLITRRITDQSKHPRRTEEFVDIASLNGQSLGWAAEVHYPVRMMLIVGLFPYKRQLQEIQRALHLSTLTAAYHEAHFSGFDVQRRKIDSSGQALEAWYDVNLAESFLRIATLTGNRYVEEDPAIQLLCHPGFVMPRPLLAEGCVYPKIENRLRFSDPSLEVRARTGRRYFSPKLAWPTQESVNVFVLSRAGRLSVNAKDDLPGGMEPTEDDLPESVLMRFIDVTIEPAVSYEYRMRVRMAVPDLPKGSESGQQRTRRYAELISSWVEFGRRISVSEDFQLFAVDMKELDPVRYRLFPPPDKNQVAFQLHRWTTRYDLIDERPTDSRVGGWIIADQVIINCGKYVGGAHSIAMPIWDYYEDEFVLASRRASRAQKRVMMPFTESDAECPILLRAEGGSVNYTKPGERKVIEDVGMPREVILLSPAGRLIVKNSVDDAQSPVRIGHFESWKKQMEKALGR